jgi:hypothetical protein
MTRPPFYVHIKDPVLREAERQRYRRFMRQLLIGLPVAFFVILGLDYIGVWAHLVG